MPLVQLVFMSSFIDEHGRDLVDLVGRSSLGKEGGDVKGMTLFSNGNILQLLQGEAFAVAKLFHALPLQTNQFQVIKLTEEVIEAISLKQTCIGFDKQAFRLHAELPNSIPIFKFSSAEIDQRIPSSAGRALSIDFAELHC